MPTGTDDRKGRQVEYSADHMTAHFDDDGNMTEVLGSHHAGALFPAQERAKTLITGDKADLHFDSTKAGKDKPDSFPAFS